MSKEVSELLDRAEVTLTNVLATYNDETDRFVIPDENLAVSLRLAVELILCAQSSLVFNPNRATFQNKAPVYSPKGLYEGPSSPLSDLVISLRKPS